MTRIKWHFNDEELALFETRHTKNRLYFALQFKYYEKHMTFLDGISSLFTKTIYRAAKKLGIPAKIKPFSKKTQATYWQEIRDYFQSRAANADDELLIKNWLIETVFPQETLSHEQLKEQVAEFLIKQKKALSELGKAIKTIFLCRYLGSEELRREMHVGLNVVERWNGINDFIFYGKKGSFHSNRPEECELSMLCLHLLQLSMVYINTLMLQQVIKELNWLGKMTLEDKRAITPLLHEHLNPYGLFLLNLNTRLAVNHPNFHEAA